MRNREAEGTLGTLINNSLITPAFETTCGRQRKRWSLLGRTDFISWDIFWILSRVMKMPSLMNTACLEHATINSIMRAPHFLSFSTKWIMPLSIFIQLSNILRHGIYFLEDGLARLNVRMHKGNAHTLHITLNISPYNGAA